MIGRWLCNLGWHKPKAHGRMQGHTTTHFHPSGSTTIPFLVCQRKGCEREYIGVVEVTESWRFPLDNPRSSR